VDHIGEDRRPRRLDDPDQTVADGQPEAVPDEAPDAAPALVTGQDGTAAAAKQAADAAPATGVDSAGQTPRTGPPAADDTAGGPSTTLGIQ